jgi:hypothetical protein
MPPARSHGGKLLPQKNFQNLLPEYPEKIGGKKRFPSFA